MRDNIRLPPLAVSGLPEGGRTHNPFGESTVLPKLGARALGRCFVQLRYGAPTLLPLSTIPPLRVTVNFPFGHQSGSGFAFSPFRVITRGTFQRDPLPRRSTPFSIRLINSSIASLQYFTDSFATEIRRNTTRIERKFSHRSDQRSRSPRPR